MTGQCCGVEIVPGQFARIGDPHPAERAHLAASLARDHDILQQRIECVEQRHAERPDMDPGARRQLEILGHPAVEDKAEFGAIGIDEAGGVAGAIKALVIEGGGGGLAIAEIAGGDGQSLDADLEPPAGGRQLHHIAGKG